MKLKKFLAVVLSVVFICSILPFGAVTVNAETSEYYTYTISNGEATITDVDISISGDVIIPSTLGGCPVTSIGDFAFYDCRSLTSIIIPNSVANIGENAFYFCFSLKSIIFSNNVTIIGNHAFYFCNSLNEVYYCGTEEQWNEISIGDVGNKYLTDAKRYYHVFGQWRFLTESGLVENSGKKRTCTICEKEEYHFQHNFVNDVCTGCNDISREKLSYTVADNQATITKCDVSISGDIEIPSILDGYVVTSICWSAFSDCSLITSIIIPDSVVSIGSNAFKNCSSLSKIIIPDSVTSIESGAFSGTAYYNNVNNWENDVIYIGNHLIEAKDTLSGDYTIKPNTKTISDCAFWGCISLTNIIIPDSVTSIGVSAFGYCGSLASITIPKGITNIGSTAFDNCNLLETVYYCGTSEQWNDIFIGYGNSDLTKATRYYHNFGEWEIVAEPSCFEEGIKQRPCSFCDEAIIEKIPILHNFIKGVCTDCNVISEEKLAFTVNDNQAIITCCDMTIGGNVVIPSTLGGYPVTSIGKYAFEYCRAITNITMPNSVIDIGTYAFSHCRLLENIIIPNSVTSIGDYAFYNCSSLNDIYYCGTEAEKSKISCDDWGYSGITNAEWHYNFQFGDTDGDGVINSLDLTKLKIVILSNNTVYGKNIACDANADNKIDVLDLIRLKKYLIGDTVTLG